MMEKCVMRESWEAVGELFDSGGGGKFWLDYNMAVLVDWLE
jgi:hypothetical protein